jgi:hypothetical protein
MGEIPHQPDFRFDRSSQIISGELELGQARIVQFNGNFSIE